VAPVPNFRIETLQTGSATMIKLAGELDSDTCNELLERAEGVLGSPGGGALLIDLQDVSFIDSSGMRALIALELRARETGTELSVTQPSEDVTELFRKTGLAWRVGLAAQTDPDQPAEPFIERIDLELAREPGAPARARAELRQALSGRLPQTESATAILLTSELVTNAVIHPRDAVGGSVGLRITSYPDRVRVEVSDPGSGFEPGTLPPRPRELGGHGLVVVAGLSSRWGAVRRVADGEGRFCVWFELDVDGPEADGDNPELPDRAAAG
jgi:anti-anti-sigma factor